jgi:predicted transposase YbfD/YdcC
VIKKVANFLLRVKDNQKARRKEIAKQFVTKPFESVTTCDKGHGRVETRTLRAMDVPAHLEEWPGVKQIIEVESVIFRDGKETRTLLHGITSLSSDVAPPKVLLDLWRNHWAIENNLHRERDVAFGEDLSPIRSGNAPQAMAALRNLIIFLARKIRKSISDLIFLCSGSYRKTINLLMEN